MPFLSFNPAWSLLISSVVNGEVPNAQGVGGVIVLTMGALVLSHANASQARPPVDAGLPPPADSSDGEHAMRGHASMLRGAAHDGVLADESTLLLADADGNAPRRPRPYSKPSGGHAHAAQPSARDARDASAMMALSGLCWASASSFEKLGLSAGRSWRAHHFLCLQKARRPDARARARAARAHSRRARPRPARTTSSPHWSYVLRQPAPPDARAQFVMAMPLLGHFLVQRFAGGSAKRARQPLPCSRRPVLALLLVSACLVRARGAAGRAPRSAGPCEAPSARVAHRSRWPTRSRPPQDTFSVLTYFMSLEWIFVSFSLALKRAGGILLAVLGGMLVFGEVVSRLAWGSIVVMVAGVILVVTS